GRWQTAQRRADPRLRAHVTGYVGSSSHLPRPLEERHLPSAEVPLLVDVAGRVRVAGLQTRPRVTTAAGERQFMIVRFTPAGAHRFLGLPLYLIANETIDLELIDRALARDVVNRVAGAAGWRDRFDAMESLIAHRVADSAIPTGVDAAWRRLVATDG